MTPMNPRRTLANAGMVCFLDQTKGVAIVSKFYAVATFHLFCHLKGRKASRKECGSSKLIINILIITFLMYTMAHIQVSRVFFSV